MVWQFLARLFEKRDDSHKWDTLDHTLKNSFSNIKKEINHIHTKVETVHTKHHDYYNHLQDIFKRLEIIESHLFKTKSSIEQPPFVKLKASQTVSYDPEKIHENLTEMQQLFCNTLAVLQKETPNKWISLKYLAQELYPNKEYSQIRSTVSQYISVLEDLGLVKRKRKGKQAFVLSTDKNPYLNLKKKKEFEIENKPAIKDGAKEKEESED